MVMEAPPSPQSVGREFVRQYYTLLNKAPAHLHRFYNQNSSFIHGGLDPPNRETSPVIGQKQIHQKIQQLNFHDCHAKITQVDSQATLGKGVVVQVTGELSNAGQPMRRFTQTFVLAAQSPKKYYVHNDIFRYQDEIISDEECEPENRSEPEDETPQECQVLNDVQQMNQAPINYYNPTNTPMQANMAPVPHHQQPHVLAPPAVPQVNGAVHPDDISVIPGPVPHVNAAAQGQVIPTPITNIQPSTIVPPLNPTAPVEEAQNELQNEEQPEINYNEVNEQENEQDLNQEPVASNEPKTYANLLKSGNNVPFNNPPMGTSGPAQQPRAVSPPNMGPRGEQGGLGNRNNMNRGPRVNQQRVQKQDSVRGAPGRPSFNEEDDRKRPQGNNFGDQNQLFLGNLPHNATEEELREIFSEFGSILDLRVHTKPANKATLPNGRAPPNYGFITYETQSGVQNCLAAKPIYYPKDDKNGTQLNVEEKKTKDRQSYGSGRPSSNDNRSRDSGPRRSGPGLGGANRNNATGGSQSGIIPNRTNNYNRGGGPPNRGPNTYNRR
ncbi:ras GTPase-activating protein-binding protein 2 [Tribolium madens]|uniref:ras GTPase-activating protein-binding protein 2 n=1 Tax=Tribolium madens TaxID=41895 RepID=UPI001CF7324F|nr:ras GTPase-activating protein-binding protein 2 [Tribolium madens]XP_044258797.1 ras GTPase-activating protein-binding protein 2 [Tribolium madens]XP_044258798.1 ras GTPase-activating protein-binding protein 2 [Tribolium madens]